MQHLSLLGPTTHEDFFPLSHCVTLLPSNIRLSPIVKTQIGDLFLHLGHATRKGHAPKHSRLQQPTHQRPGRLAARVLTLQRLRRRWPLPAPCILHRHHRLHHVTDAPLLPLDATSPGEASRRGQQRPPWRGSGGADATSPAPRSSHLRKHVAVGGGSTPTPRPATTGARGLRCGEETTHLCVPAQLVPKIGVRFAYVVGDCFFLPKTLCATQNLFGFRFGCSVGDSLTWILTNPQSRTKWKWQLFESVRIGDLWHDPHYNDVPLLPHFPVISTVEPHVIYLQVRGVGSHITICARR